MANTYGPQPPAYTLPTQNPAQKRTSRQDSMMNYPPLINMYVNAVYYPNWRIYRQQPPSSLKLDCISHIFYAFAWVQPDGTVYLSDEWADEHMDVDGVKGCLRACTAIRKGTSGIPKVLLSVGGGGKGSENFSAVASKAETRQRFAESCREICIKFNLDGIDVDWEYPSTPQEGADYVQLLYLLRYYLPLPRFQLTTALPANEWALKNINLVQASQYVNFINIMTYDFAGSWTPAAGHHAQLMTPAQPHNEAARVSCFSAVSYFLSQGIPPYRLVVGIPAYGRSFQGAQSAGHAYSGHGGEEGTFEYRDLPRPGAQEFVDEAVGAAYCVGGDGGFVSYDNDKTVKMKAKFVKQYGLQGLFYWTGTADADNSRSLIYNGFEELHSVS